MDIEVTQVYRAKNGLLYSVELIQNEIGFITCRVGNSDLTLDFTFGVFQAWVDNGDIALI